MSDGAGLEDRLETLLRLLSERPQVTMLPAGDAVDAFAMHQLADVSAERFDALTSFVADCPQAERGDDVSRLAIRALLDDYAAAVRQMRAVARVSARTLDDADLGLACCRGLVDRHDV